MTQSLVELQNTQAAVALIFHLPSSINISYQNVPVNTIYNNLSLFDLINQTIIYVQYKL